MAQPNHTRTPLPDSPDISPVHKTTNILSFKKQEASHPLPLVCQVVQTEVLPDLFLVSPPPTPLSNHKKPPLQSILTAPIPGRGMPFPPFPPPGGPSPGGQMPMPGLPFPPPDFRMPPQGGFPVPPLQQGQQQQQGQLSAMSPPQPGGPSFLPPGAIGMGGPGFGGGAGGDRR